jgi:hypothetical protein
MPDSPDYSKYLLTSVRFSLQDLGELASRLGSPDLYDRRGVVIAMDDCSHGLARWAFNAGGGPGTVSITADGRIAGGYRIQMQHTGVAPLSNSLSRFFQILSSNRYGMETIFSTPINLDKIGFDFQLQKPDHYVRGGWHHDVTKGHLYLGYNLAETVDLGTIGTIITSDDYPLFAKMVVDDSKTAYAWLQYRNTLYDLSADALTFAASAGAPNLFFRMWMVAKAGSSTVMWIDSVILTADEP